MDKEKIKSKKNQLYFTAMALIVISLIFLANSFITQTPVALNSEKTMPPVTGKIILAEPFKADEVYGLFICSCCNRPLDKENICCGSAKERLEYIDSLEKTEISKTDAIIKMVKKYGMESLSDEGKKLEEEIRLELAERAPENRPKIIITPDSYDFGEVSVRKGTVSKIMTIRNDGESDLVINNMDSSCMCTTASIIFNGVEGPIFGMSMHGNPKGWSVTIPPKQQAQLKIYYDPTVHSGLEGQHLVRVISVFSNDSVDFEKKVRIDIDQVE